MFPIVVCVVFSQKSCLVLYFVFLNGDSIPVSLVKNNDNNDDDDNNYCSSSNNNNNNDDKK